MALSVSVATVKAKCRISVSTFDTEISNLIDEQLPVIEFAVLDEHIADTGNTNLQKTLNLGAAEVIAGEFIAQAMREPGGTETLILGELTIGSRVRPGAIVSDAYGLKAQGWLRLSPYLKPLPASNKATQSVARASEPALSDEEVSGW